MKKLIIFLLLSVGAFGQNVRPKDEPATSEPAYDDVLLLDGLSQGTRSITAGYYQPESANLTGWSGKTVPSGSIADLTSTQTFSGKTFDAGSNTFKINGVAITSLGSNMSIIDGALTGGGGSGVTSVGLSVPSFLSVSGSPINSSGTLAVSYSGTPLPITSGGSAATTVPAAVVNLTPVSVAISGTAINWALGTVFSQTLSANTTFTFSNSVDGEAVTVVLTNTSSNWTVTWPTVKWSGGSAPIITVGAHTDVYSFLNVGGAIYGASIQNY